MVHDIEPLVVVFVDLTGSTREMKRRGAWRVTDENVARLAGMQRAFQTADPTARRINSTGDGFFMLAKDPVAILVAALLEQARWAALHVGLPARIALGQDLIVWDGVPWDSDAHGDCINLTARLLQVCPDAGVVLSESIHESVRERPEVRGRLVRSEAVLKGLGRQRYWIVGTSGEEVLSMMDALARNRFAMKTLVGLLITVATMTSGWAWSASRGAVSDLTDKVVAFTIDNVRRDVRLTTLEERLSSIDRKLDILLQSRARADRLREPAP